MLSLHYCCLLRALLGRRPHCCHLISDSALMVRQGKTADINGDGATDVVALYQEILFGLKDQRGKVVLGLRCPSGLSGRITVSFGEDVDGDGDAEMWWNMKRLRKACFGLKIRTARVLWSPTYPSFLQIWRCSTAFDLVDLNSDGLLDVVVFYSFETHLVWFEHLANGSLAQKPCSWTHLPGPMRLNTLDVGPGWRPRPLCRAWYFDGSINAWFY